MESLIDKVVIITGASSGIGRALAYEMAGKKARLSLAARNVEALKKVENEIESHADDVMIHQTDVTDELQCKDLIERTMEHFGRIDVLINNAGISMRATLENMDLEVFRKVVDVNLMGAVYCTKYALPYLLKSKGSVVGVSSIAGYVGLPARTAYSSSKYALQGFLDALRTENRKTGLHVLVACPGYTESNIRKRALNAEGTSQDESPLKEDKIMPASEVARAITKAIERRKRTLTLTTEGKMAVFFSKFFPSFIEAMVFKKVSSEPGSPIRMQ
ncbi:MAG: SDR family oxidoreductase [Vicingaceae bacterium]